jgi:hypothetical protein
MSIEITPLPKKERSMEWSKYWQLVADYRALELRAALTIKAELLKALKYHHEWQMDHAQREGFGYINSKAYCDTTAAIAKAEGKC